MSANVKRAEQIICEAMALNPVAIRVGFSGGNDSLAVTHWMMHNVPGCEVFHCNTGIGVEATRQFVRDTCARQGFADAIRLALEDRMGEDGETTKPADRAMGGE